MQNTQNYKTALITGGARGIGRGIALALAEEKWNIVITGTKNSDQAADTLAELRKYGIQAVYIQGDISSAHDRESLLHTIKKQFGCLHALINNAGVAPKVRTDILDATEESFDYVIAVNLKGPYFLTQLAAKWMISQKKENNLFQGYIINISSVSAITASPNRGEYCISKAGIHMATKLWAVRLGEYDIPVYEICPGVIETDMTSGVHEKYSKMIEDGLCLQKRWGTPEDIGKAAAMIVRGDIRYATGQSLYIDGGLTVPRL